LRHPRVFVGTRIGNDQDMENRDTDERAEDLPRGTADEQPGRERTSMDREAPRAEDPLIRREERAAAAEAGAIGGPRPDVEGDEASRPVEEAGGGEAEGFELAERELEEQASHGENRSSPEVDAFPPEDSAEDAAPAYGEPDEVDATEVVRDPREGPDDPGSGPGLAADR
jgi:hypothetical protein